MDKSKVLVLFSGGMDSMACIKYYLDLGFSVEGLFIDYGQLAKSNEKKAVKALSAFFKIKTKIIRVNIIPITNCSVIQGRNEFLLAIAHMYFPYKKGIISLGIHSGTNFPDCNPRFINYSQKIIDLYASGQIIIDCPFIELQKIDIFEYCINKNLPIDISYSCENGVDGGNCGKCLSCIEIKEINEHKIKHH